MVEIFNLENILAIGVLLTDLYSLELFNWKIADHDCLLASDESKIASLNLRARNLKFSH